MTFSTNLTQKFLLLICLFAFGNMNAQNVNDINLHSLSPKHHSQIAKKVSDAQEAEISFPTYSLLSKSITNTAALKLFNVREASLFQLNTSSLAEITNQKPEAIKLNIPLSAQESIDIVLVQSSPLDKGFYVTTSDGSHPDYDRGTFYQGVVKNNEENSIVAITIFKDKVLGMISIDQQNLILDAIPNEPNSLIVYDDKNVTKTSELSCLADKLEPVIHPDVHGSDMTAGDCIRVYVECDFALYNNKGSVQATVDWMTSVFNNIKTLYTNESINTTLSEVYVWTSADPYSKTDSYTALSQFKTQRPTFNGDLAHLAALGGNNLGGIAWIDALCSTYKYAYSNISATYATVPTYSWTVEVMTHEMGHNVGSNHTQWCGWVGGAIDNCYTTEGGCPPGPAPTNGGTIMSYCHLTSYGINFSNGFGPLPGDKLRTSVIAAKCLGTSCSGGSCGTPSGLVISNITNTSAKATWNPVTGANSYDFEYKVSTSNTWTVVNGTATNYTMNGLTAGLTYNTRVKAKCSGGDSPYSAQINFTTTGGGGGCGTPTNFAVTNITSNSATTSWTAVAGANSYNLQYKLTTSQTWSQFNTTATTVNFTGLAAGTSYDVRVQTVCTSGNSAFTSTITFITLTSSYCTSKGNNATFEWISRVKIGTIDRVSASDGGYYNGTGLVSDVVKGTTYTFSHQAGTTGNSGTLYWKVWIDWNRNNSFADAGEEVLVKASALTTLQTANITVPAGASTGTTRMRVSVKYGGYSTSCLTYTYGEVEDYTLNIKAAGTFIDPNHVVDFQSVQVQPNPFNNNLNVFVNAEKNQEVKITISNLLGQFLTAEKRYLLQGANSIDLDLSNLLPSTYILNLETDTQSWQKKIIKQE